MILIFNYVIEDADGERSRLDLIFAPDIDITTAQINSLMLDVWAIIAPACDGRLIDAYCRLDATISSVVQIGLPDVLSDIQEKCIFYFRSSARSYRNFSIPAFIEELFTDGGAGENADLGYTQVTGIITLMEDGLLISGADYLRATDNRGFPLTEFVTTKQDFG